MLYLFNNIWWSAVADPDEWSTPDSGYLTLEEAGGSITGIAGLGDYFIAFQELVYTVFSKNVGDTPFTKLTTIAHGCNSFKTIQEVNGALFYLASDGDIRVTNGSSDVCISDNIKEITKDITDGRTVADYYGTAPMAMPSAIYIRNDNVYKLFYAGSSAYCDKCLTYFIDKQIWTGPSTAYVTSCAPTIDNNYQCIIGNSNSSGITYKLISKYSNPDLSGTLDLGFISSGNPNSSIKIYNIKVWVHAHAGQVAGDNCDCTITLSVYNDASGSTIYASEGQSLTYNGVVDNLQELTFNNVKTVGRYVRVVLTDSGTNKNYSIDKILIKFDVLDTTN